MIDIKTLPLPQILQELSYEEILAQNLAEFKKILPDYEDLESDNIKMLLESFSYRELYLRASFNDLSKAFFLSTSTGNDLDNYAIFYAQTRLQGSKPYAEYEFSLSEVLNQDLLIPARLVLTDPTSKYTAILLTDVIITKGQTKVSGTLELQVFIKQSSVKTEVITTALPFLIAAKAQGEFQNGASIENDADFRTRILLSLADKSTAGSLESYKSYALKADERIQDISILNGGAGIVNVYYFSTLRDDVMQARIEKALNKEDVRPLTDNVIVKSCELVSFSIEAELKILENQETLQIVSNALASLKVGLENLKQIGTNISTSEINYFLKVPGVKEVIITKPTQDIVLDNTQIGVNDESNNIITYSII